MFKFGDKQIRALIKAIFDGKIDAGKLPVQLYYAIADHLKSGVYKGFGFTLSSLSKEIKKASTVFELRDLELLAELRTNVYMFSAAKTYQQVKDMAAAITDDNGTVRPFKEFEETARQTFDLYNETWLQTEYNTAIGQAESAMAWRNFERDADVLPLLEYDATMDANTSEICAPLNGIIAPVDDPIWDAIMPLNHFNCRCIVRQREEGKTTPDGEKEQAYKDATEQMQDVFKMNPGKDGYIFKEDHPYFSVPKEDKEYAKRNFDLPIPKND